jgi:hypothetical protein
MFDHPVPESLAPAVWPKQAEIFTHLQLSPWIPLPVSFSPKLLLAESLALLPFFVEHRPSSQPDAVAGRWRSLALRAVGGKADRTYGADHYAEAEAYQNTEIAALCSHTMEFLAQITDIAECDRIRFMLLEPGAEIMVHSDAPEKDTSLAVNIALNMPSGCEFWVDLNPDGTKNRYSRRIPIQDGYAFLFNTASYHAVVNGCT